jgi:hypothetical protein
VEEQVTERKMSLPVLIREIAGRLEAMAAWADDCMDNKLPVTPDYLERLAGWVEEDASQLSDKIRAIAHSIR